MACSAAALLAACSNSGSAVTNYTDNMAVENLTAENLVVDNLTENPSDIAPPALPDQHYDFREGDLYGYLGAVSEEQSKKGVATPSVVMFRYTGFWGDAHHLQWIGDNGAVLESAECNVPCVAIKVRYANGSLERLGYNPNSIIGGAFEDAINGRLERAPAPGTVKDGYRFKGGDPASAANWQSISPPAAPAQPDSRDVENLTAENLVVENTS